MRMATSSTAIRLTHAGSTSWLARTTFLIWCQKAAAKIRSQRWIGFAATISTLPNQKGRKHDYEESFGGSGCHRTNFQRADRAGLESAYRCRRNETMVFRPERIHTRGRF